MMRVSIINVNLVYEDAIGRCILNKMRYFRGRGDRVMVYLQHRPETLPSDAEGSIHWGDGSNWSRLAKRHFRNSDLCIFHYPGRYPLLDTLNAPGPASRILYYHNVTPPELWRHPAIHEGLRAGVDNVPACLRHVDLVITPSHANASHLVREHGCSAEEIRVLPLAAANREFNPHGPVLEDLGGRNPAGRRILLYVGRMAGNKRIDLLIRALAALRQSLPEAILVLVGDDEGNPAIRHEVERARTLAETLGVGEDVIFTGRVDDVSVYMRTADVYMTASLHEGFGVPLIEAMASGLPVVASDIPAHAEVLGKAGRLVEAGNANALAGEALALLSDPAAYSRLASSGLERAQRYSLENYEQGLNDILAGVPGTKNVVGRIRAMVGL